MGVTFHHKGDFSKTEKFLNMLLHKDWKNLLERYGREGVQALRSATPRDSGLAANSWDYIIEKNGDSYSLSWINTDIEGGYSVVVLIDKGHVTKNGGWFSGYNFIDETLDPIMHRLAKEVTFE